MSLVPPIITVMEKACKNASKSLIRDFGELEKLQISKKFCLKHKFFFLLKMLNLVQNTKKKKNCVSELLTQYHKCKLVQAEKR